MMNRRGFVLSLTTGLVALVLVVGSVLAEELGDPRKIIRA